MTVICKSTLFQLILGRALNREGMTVNLCLIWVHPSWLLRLRVVTIAALEEPKTLEKEFSTQTDLNHSLTYRIQMNQNK